MMLYIGRIVYTFAEIVAVYIGYIIARIAMGDLRWHKTNVKIYSYWDDHHVVKNIILAILWIMNTRLAGAYARRYWNNVPPEGAVLIIFVFTVMLACCGFCTYIVYKRNKPRYY